MNQELLVVKWKFPFCKWEGNNDKDNDINFAETIFGLLYDQNVCIRDVWVKEKITREGSILRKGKRKKIRQVPTTKIGIGLQFENEYKLANI